MIRDLNKYVISIEIIGYTKRRRKIDSCSNVFYCELKRVFYCNILSDIPFKYSLYELCLISLRYKLKSNSLDLCLDKLILAVTSFLISCKSIIDWHRKDIFLMQYCSRSLEMSPNKVGFRPYAVFFDTS